MKLRTIILAIVSIAVLGLALYFALGARQPATASAVKGISVEKPNLVVRGANLGKVEIWAIPTGTGITEANYQKLGLATLASTSPDGTETWTFAIPAEPILATQIFAKGYAANGSLVGSTTLEAVGASSIYDALWGTGADLTVSAGKATGTFEDLTITYKSFVQDSRCPIDAQCIQAGAVTVNVMLSRNGASETRDFRSDAAPYRFGPYEISITNVTPQPMSGKEIPPKDYAITFHVEDVSSGLSPAATAVRAYAANDFNVPTSEVIVLDTTQHEWPDSCFGLGGPAESCLQAIVNGWQVSVNVNGAMHIYRTNDAGSVIREEKSPAQAGLPVKLYFYNALNDQGTGGAQCSRAGLVAVNRMILRTTAPLKDTIALLLRGELSRAEREQGIATEFPLPGVSLTSATISNGVATLTFADLQNRTSGGSCRAGVLWYQIEATAKQFPGVTQVKFAPATLFQP